MHPLGKVLAFLVLILAFVATWFSAKTLNTRNAWMKHVEGRRAPFAKSIDDLEVAKADLQDAQEENRRVQLGWAPVLGTNVQVTANGNNGIALQNLGATAGLRPNQLIHVFAPTQTGGTIYLGPFRTTQVNPGNAAATADFPLRQVDQANWQRNVPPANNYRVYGNVPAYAIDSVIEFNQKLVLKEELLGATQALADAREQEVQVANEHLLYRDNELNGGDPNMEKDRGILPVHMVDGLVKALELQDEERNAEVLAVDELRHELKREFDRVTTLRERNQKLVDSLPKPDVSDSAVGSAVGE